MYVVAFRSRRSRVVAYTALLLQSGITRRRRRRSFSPVVCVARHVTDIIPRRSLDVQKPSKSLASTIPLCRTSSGSPPSSSAQEDAFDASLWRPTPTYMLMPSAVLFLAILGIDLARKMSMAPRHSAVSPQRLSQIALLAKAGRLAVETTASEVGQVYKDHRRTRLSATTFPVSPRHNPRTCANYPTIWWPASNVQPDTCLVPASPSSCAPRPQA